MDLQFYSVTTHGTNCVYDLLHELKPLEQQAKNWTFPYDITITVRCKKNAGETFRRFYQKEQTLEIDIRQEDSDYMALSKNEQREHLGKLIYSYLKESIKKYPKFATTSQQEYLITKFEEWMLENNWLNGKVKQARLMLKQGKETFEVSEILKIPLAEVEDILFSLDEVPSSTTIHPDNMKEGKNEFL